MNKLRLLFGMVLFSIALLLGNSQAKAQITVSSATGCAPHTTSFSISGSYASFQWSFGNGMSASIAQPSALFAQNGVYGVTVTATTSNGNNETFTLNNAVTVYADPAPEFYLNQDTFCLGDTLSAAIQQANSSSAYYWTFGDGNTATTSTAIHVFTQPGLYSVNVEETNGEGCASFGTAKTVYVSPKPSAAFSISDSLVCNPYDTLQVSSLSSGSAYSWKVDNVPHSNSSSFFLSFSQTGTHTISLDATNEVGCTAFSSHAVWVNELPSLSIETDDTLGCAPYTVQLSASSSTQGVFNWTTPFENLSGDSISTIITQEGKYEVEARFTDNVGCAYIITSDSIEALPVPDFDVIISDSVLCDSGTIEFTFDADSLYNVNWTFNAQQQSGDSVQFFVNEPGNYGFSVEAEMSNGCESTWEIPNAVRIETGQSLNDFSEVSSCSELTFLAEHFNPYLQSALWVMNGDSSSSEIAQFQLDEIGVYDLVFVGQSEHGCTDTTVYPEVVKIVESKLEWNSPSTIESCNSTQVTFDGNVLADTNFSWVFGDGSADSGNIVSHTFSVPGTYVVSMQAQNIHGCDVSIDTHTIVTIESQEADYGFDVLDCANTQVQFYSLSSAENWYWEIGNDTFYDSSFVAEINPYFPHHVKHIATSAGGCSSQVLDLNAIYLDSCLASYSGNIPMPASNDPSTWYPPMSSAFVHCSPATIQFNHPEDSLILVIFDFGDGDTAHSGNGTAVHTYDSAGIFDVSISAIDINDDTATYLLSGFLQIGAPKANFEPEVLNMCNGGDLYVNNLSLASSSWITLFGDGGSSTTQFPTYHYDSAGFYTIQHIAEDQWLCTSSSHRLISVANPTPEFDFSLQMCAGDSQRLNHNVVGFDTYVWHFGDSLFTGRTPLVSISQPGDYNLSLEAIDTNGCSQTFFDSLTFTVNKPQVSFELLASGFYCGPLDTVLNPNTSGVDVLKWYINNEFSSTDAVFHLQLTEAGSHEITLKGIGNGCVAIQKDTVAVRIPQADFSFNTSDYCLPQTVQFTDNSSQALNWEWNFGDGNTSNQQHPTVVFDSYSSDSIRLKISDSLGCEAHKTAPSIPFYQVDIQLDQDEYCFPAQPVIQDIASQGSQYIWHFSDTTVFGQDSFQLTINDTSELSFQVLVTFQSGCTTTVNMDSAALIHKPFADFEINANSGSCAPKSIGFTNTSVQNAAAFSWNFGEGGGSTAEHPNYAFAQPGNFNVSLTITDENACTAERLIKDAVSINGPLINFEWLENLLCEDDSFSMVNTTINASEYLWFFGDGVTSSSVNPKHAYSEAGEYHPSLLAMDSSGCSSMKEGEAMIANPRPEPKFDIKQLGECKPAPFVLSDSSTHLLNPTYFVFAGEQKMQVQPDEPFYVESEGKYLMKMTIENKNGCLVRSHLTEQFTVFDTTANSAAMLKDISSVNNAIQFSMDIKPASNFKAVDVFRKEGSALSQVWSGKGNDSTVVFLDQEGFDQNASTCYKVKIDHHCHSEIPEHLLPEYCSIQLSGEENDHQRLLTWNPIGEVAVSGYKILSRRNAREEFSMIGEIDPSQHHFIDSIDACPGKVEYRVSAVLTNSSEEAKSSISQLEIDTLPFLKKSIDVTYVSVLEDNSVMVEWDGGSFESPLVSIFEVERSSDRGDKTSFAVDRRSNYLIDTEVETDLYNYQYKVKAIDRCGFKPTAGISLETILLLIEQDENQTELKWNEVDQLKEKMIEYEIQVRDEYGIWNTIERLTPDEKKSTLDLREVDAD
ncbi:MAG: PKD domain-containing protein [Salibacteraceae bacterium]